MSALPEASLPIHCLHALESALAGSPEKADCLRRLREILAQLPGGAPDRTLTPPERTTGDAGGPAHAQPMDTLGAAVLQALPTQIAALDGNGFIVAVNDAWWGFAQDNGGSPSALGVGTNYLDVCNRARGERSEEAPAALRGIRSVLDGTQSLFSLEYPCDAPQIRRWFLMHVTPLGIEPRGALVTHLDITGRKRGEELAQRQHAQLAQVARMHTVGALATAIAHEISQPLAAIGIYSNAAAHLLESQHASPGEVADVLRQIEAQVQRTGEIVGRVRELTRWHAAETGTIDLYEAVAEAARLTRPMATERQVSIALAAPDRPVLVSADRVRIVQVVINLLCNGIEAIALADSPQRRVSVSIRREGDRARVTVADSGPGIRPGWEERIFDIFETDKATGSGMGLAISRSLVEGLGGRLWADPGHKPGAAFHFTLPGAPEVQEESE